MHKKKVLVSLSSMFKTAGLGLKGCKSRVLLDWALLLSVGGIWGCLRGLFILLDQDWRTRKTIKEREELSVSSDFFKSSR